MKYYYEVQKIAPVPFISALIDDCLEKGKDLTDRGARYTFYAPLATGFSHCVDSLAVVKKLVYEDKRVTMGELLLALRSNWEGKERLRQLCINGVPKYGNDNEYVDSIGREVLRHFCDRVGEWSKKVDWLKFPCGIGTFENYPRFGNNAGASPDGRKAREPVSSNYSPSVGRDQNGPTAVVRSSTRFDLRRVNDGCPVDIKLSPNGVQGEAGVNKLMQFVKGFLASGGNMVTITVVDAKTLRAAQKEPKKYASLRVRLGGLSAYFVQIAPQQQEELIRRTEHGY
jgi:formate C-acetyltransferase